MTCQCGRWKRVVWKCLLNNTILKYASRIKQVPVRTMLDINNTEPVVLPGLYKKARFQRQVQECEQNFQAQCEMSMSVQEEQTSSSIRRETAGIDTHGNDNVWFSCGYLIIADKTPE